MRKPTWIRVVGWLGLAALVASGATCLAGGMNKNVQAVQIGVLPLFVAMPLLGLWVVASIVHGLIAHNARAKAEAMSGIAPRASLYMAPPPGTSQLEKPAQDFKPASRRVRTGPLDL